MSAARIDRRMRLGLSILVFSASALYAAAQPAAAARPVEWSPRIEASGYEDWYISSRESSVKVADGVPSLVLKDGSPVANALMRMGRGEISGMLRFMGSPNSEYWVGVSWGVSNPTVNGAIASGYYFIITQDGYAHLFRGPWSEKSKTIADASSGIDLSKPFAFSVRVDGSGTVVAIEGRELFRLPPDGSVLGYAGVIGWAPKELTMSVSGLRLRGEAADEAMAGDAPAASGAAVDLRLDPARGLGYDWLSSFAKISGEKGATPRVAIEGKYLGILQGSPRMASGELSGTIRMILGSAPNSGWSGLQWAVPLDVGHALADGGYFITIYPNGDLNLCAGPWGPDSRPISSIHSEIDPTKPLAFALKFGPGGAFVFLNGRLRFVVDDAKWKGGWAGVLNYSENGARTEVTELRLRGVADPERILPAPPWEGMKGKAGKEILAGVGARRMVRIEGGTLQDQGFKNAVPSFSIGAYEVTWELWHTVRLWALANGYAFQNIGGPGGNDADGSPPDAYTRLKPVRNVSWRDCLVWCNAYSEMEGLRPCYYSDAALKAPIRDSKYGSFAKSVAKAKGSFDDPFVDRAASGYRIPSYAEWAWAATARGATPTDYSSGADAPAGEREGGKDVDGNGEVRYTMDVAWCSENTWGIGYTPRNDGSKPVGMKAPNALGLYDMSGNIGELLFDWSGTPPTADQKDYRGPASGEARMWAGATAGAAARYQRIAVDRSEPSRDERGAIAGPWSKAYIGLRVARSD